MQLYSQQTEALASMMRFLGSTDSVFILKGYAGTGKTTLIRVFCDELKKNNRIPILMAPTGRAAKVLREKTGIEATTIHKVIYHRSGTVLMYHDDNGELQTPIPVSDKHTDIEEDSIKIYFDIKKISEWKDNLTSVVIVDESSLISSKPASHEVLHFGTNVLISDLLTFAQLPLGTKIVFVGDPAQLPPVGDNQSCALSEDYFKGLGIGAQSYTLTDVVRQKSDSIILANAMKVRNILNSPLRNELCFETNEGVFESVSAQEVVDRYTKLFPRPMLNQGVVICYSNRKTQSYNHFIRSCYYNDEALHKGDILQVVHNNYDVMAGACSLMNGDFIRVTAEPEAEEIHNIPVWSKRKGAKEKVNIELRFQTIEFETDCNMKCKAKILTNFLYNDSPSLSQEESIALYIDFAIRHPELKPQDMMFAEEIMKDLYFNAIRAKFGYAITCHKSQGGEWPTVFVDYSGRTGLDNDSLRWNYTGYCSKKCV